LHPRLRGSHEPGRHGPAGEALFDRPCPHQHRPGTARTPGLCSFGRNLHGGSLETRGSDSGRMDEPGNGRQDPGCGCERRGDENLRPAVQGGCRPVSEGERVKPRTATLKSTGTAVAAVRDFAFASVFNPNYQITHAPYVNGSTEEPWP